MSSDENSQDQAPPAQALQSQAPQAGAGLKIEDKGGLHQSDSSIDSTSHSAIQNETAHSINPRQEETQQSSIPGSDLPSASVHKDGSHTENTQKDAE